MLLASLWTTGRHVITPVCCLGSASAAAVIALLRCWGEGQQQQHKVKGPAVGRSVNRLWGCQCWAPSWLQGRRHKNNL